FPVNTIGCPLNRRILYMGVAADCSYMAAIGGTLSAGQSIIEAALERILRTWNAVSAIYAEQFNVALGVTEVVLQTDCRLSSGDSGLLSSSTDTQARWNQACSAAYTIADRLNDFS